MKRTATVNWKGSGKEGKGTMSTQSGVLKNSQYSANSRFENGIGTNPEELIAAAHAGCFSMKFGFLLAAAGFTPENIDTKCTITLESGVITESHLEMKASIPNIDEAKFNEVVADAKVSCPVSKALNTNITLEASLVKAVTA